MSRLRVCHIIHNTQVGGAEAMLLELLTHLAGSDVESSVISLMQCGPTGVKIRQLGVPVSALDCVRNGSPRPLRLVGLVRQLRKLRPDVVQTWAYHADLCGGVAARMTGRAPVIWNVRHGSLDPAIESRNTLRSARLCGRLSAWVPARIVLNSRFAVAVHQNAGYDISRMQVIPNGFDTNRFKPLPNGRERLRTELRLASDVPVVGMCGRFHPHKGPQDFVRAARLILRRHPKAQFVMAGRGCDTSNAELMNWLASHNVGDRVHLLGCRDDMPDILRSLDVYLLPSITEGFPNVVGEAMSCGIVCVVTDVGDAKRIVGDCGAAVSSRDPAAMADEVCRFLALPATERVAMGAKARERILQQFDIMHIAARYRSTWWEVAGTSHRGSVGRFEKRLAAATDAVRSPGVHSAAPAVSTRQRLLASDGVRAKPKLVHVTTIPLTQWLFLRGQNTFMQQHGFEVHAVSSPGPLMAKLRERDRVHTHAISISRRIEPIRDLLTVFRLWRLFRRLRPEIVQLSTTKAALLGAVAAWLARVPIRIFQMRGLLSECESGWKRVLCQRLERLIARSCNGCLVNAQSLLDHARRTKILGPRDGHVAGQGMSNGIDLARFDPDSTCAVDLRAWDVAASGEEARGPVIGYVGRLTHDKGIEELFAAWNNLRDEFPTARLLLVGHWEAECATSAACRDGLHADPRVLLVGPQDDVVSFYRAMNLFVFPSHGTEGFPNAPMEAAAMGLPVIATRVIGCVDAVIDGVTGQVISPRSANELEMALRTYLSNAELRQRHAQAGQARVRSGFVPCQLWREFHAYYVQLLRRQGLPLPTDAAAEPDVLRAA